MIIIMLRILKKLFIGIIRLIGVLALVYLLGPRPEKPVFAMPDFSNASSLSDLEKELSAAETAEPGIKAGCDARIVWADSSKKEKTKIAMVYLHGFGASREEGAPLPENIARHFGCNLFLARLDQHGVEEGDGNLCELTADSYVASAERALHIAKQLGDSVVILGTSGGGGLGLFLASRHPDLKALVLWSPAIKLARPEAGLLSGPWGLQLARLLTGKHHNDWAFRKPVMAKFWTNHQCFEGIVQFATFLKYAQVPENFAKIKCPLFVGYYYENEENQDKSVSVAAMREMFAQVGTPPSLKREMAFPNTKDHIIGCQIVSQDWQSVQAESIMFLSETVFKK
jgi:pimeloyl-ACP methyl ester carboxylesterase